MCTLSYRCRGCWRGNQENSHSLYPAVNERDRKRTAWETCTSIPFRDYTPVLQQSHSRDQFPRQAYLHRLLWDGERDSVHGLSVLLVLSVALREDITSLAKKNQNKTKKSTKRKAHYINGYFEKLQEAIGICDQASTDLENITQQFSSLPKMDGGGEVNEMRGERDLGPSHEWVNTVRSSVFPLSLYTAKTCFIIRFC